ncbi:hypothetical protein [Dactylosporangium salmoneum]|uniref:LysM domain-containing protein n=1 Tax=Dactylosporangium salmoneum TaxID=53361 RepID=A0ABN3HGH9_9ACTN
MTSISGISGISGSYGIQFQASRPPQRPKDGQDPLEPVAKALSLSAGDLKSKLEDGSSLNEIAEQQGVSHDDLIAAIKAGKPSDAPAAPDGVSDDEMAEKIAAQQGRPGPPPGGGAGGPAGLRDSSKLQQLGTLLNSDTDDLSQLSATELVKKFQSKGLNLDQLSSVLNSGDLVDVKA